MVSVEVKTKKRIQSFYNCLRLIISSTTRFLLNKYETLKCSSYVPAIIIQNAMILLSFRALSKFIC
jgi:hypothetical protein